MRVSLKWLQDYIKITLPAKELAEKLTMAGIEVKKIEVIGEAWEKVVVGEIVAVSPHPNADRLKLVTVNLGQQELTVVSGAPNLKTGDKVPFAHVGAQLRDAHTGEIISVRPAKIRGVLSEGMVCSEKELGISDNHEGIMVLPSEAPVGISLAEYLGDVIFDLDVTPNRPDCLSVIGIAREVAALTQQTIYIPQVFYEESAHLIDSLITVTIAEPVLCPRYCASLIIGVKVSPSPRWLKQRLLACGMRPINNIVDVTNYVMLEYGQPLHAFDYHRIVGRQIIVRKAKIGEMITTLDKMERALASDVLVIADAERAIAIAGIMGGFDTEVTEETTTVLLESANFNRTTIRRTCANLGLRTEASLRFEKGLSPELTLPALRRATQLILELAGGKAAKGILDVYPGRQERQSLLLSIAQIQRLLGMEVGVDETIKTLTLLGFQCVVKESGQISVTVPYWRTDISNSADLVEEVARIIGYDKIPATMLSSPIPSRQSTPELVIREKLRNIMISCGFQEVLTYSLVSFDMLRKIYSDLELLPPLPLKVANPVTKEQEYLRTSLRANLLSTLSQNQRHESAGLKLFEIGKVFLPRGKDLPEEKEKLCAVINGRRSELSWRQIEGEFDFFDTKGIVECLLSWLGGTIRFVASEDKSLHPGRRADVLVDEVKVGVFGELHPKVAEAFKLSGTTYLIELDLAELLPLARLKKYTSLPRFPGAIRDIAVVLDENIPYERVKTIIQSFPLVAHVTLFDLYQGEPVPSGKKSLAFRIVYQAPTQTLTDEQVSEVQQQILDTLYRELGATLRT